MISTENEKKIEISIYNTFFSVTYLVYYDFESEMIDKSFMTFV